MATIEKRPLGNNKFSYRVRIRIKGKPQETASFERLTDARLWAQQTEADIRRGKYFSHSNAKKFNLSQLIDKYIDEYLVNKPKRLEDVKAKLEWWKKTIGYVLLLELNSSALVKARQKLLDIPKKNGEKRSFSTVNRYTSALSHCFSIAVNEWNLLESNPFNKISNLEEPKGVVRYLSDDERVRLLEVVSQSKSPYLEVIVMIALSTGARQGEILNLEWSNVDIKGNKIVLFETKNGEKRVLPLKGKALEMVKDLYNKRDYESNLVFPSIKDKKVPIQIRDSWETSLKKADIKNFRFHDLRHTAASYLAMNGATPSEIAEILGHKTLQMVKRYSHLSESHTSSVVERMNQKMFGDR
ncbi:MAG: site-specific integrase [Alphaproteobacteria bacterium]|jgi:integrase|nr:site-specific integrase [Alphaproteobacteria bacterium]